jgi:hypothetical protein
MSNQNCYSANAVASHPLRELLGEVEFAKLAKDVQAVRVSWPICIEVRKRDERLDVDRG